MCMCQPSQGYAHTCGVNVRDGFAGFFQKVHCGLGTAVDHILQRKKQPSTTLSEPAKVRLSLASCLTVEAILQVPWCQR